MVNKIEPGNCLPLTGSCSVESAQHRLFLRLLLGVVGLERGVPYLFFPVLVHSLQVSEEVTGAVVDLGSGIGKGRGLHLAEVILDQLNDLPVRAIVQVILVLGLRDDTI